MDPKITSQFDFAGWNPKLKLWTPLITKNAVSEKTPK
jgi:hypothetical protein